ncbi:MAG: 6-carboxytetrahydropterin synthase [Syntrophales bacterium]|jgi:6-pyruvoyltetrahydropterin/6-carboxytetrahydropterin synthase|nr:6-carboxytetrahydropterin synthase [Syntrophales bacterium]
MFQVAVRRHFTARHFLIGGDWGRENRPHEHSYTVEVRLEGHSLDGHGFLMDIVEIEGRMDGIVNRLKDRLLNELPEFAGLNPSVERLADSCCRWFLDGLKKPTISVIEVRVFENEDAWAACRREVP